MVISTRTWNRETHGLFDYESHLITSNQLRTRSSASIVRIGDECSIWRDNKLPRDSFTSLCRVVFDKTDKNFHKIYVTKEGYERIWLIIKKMSSPEGVKGCRLKVGDVIKIGRVKLRIKEIRGQSQCVLNEDQRPDQT